MINHNSISYFNQRAHSYNLNSHSWPWSWLRALESAAIDTMMGNVAGLDILDLGCGAGFYAHHYLKQNPNRLVAVDLSEAMISQITDNRIECEVGNAASITIGVKFDKIVSAGLLEFVEDAPAVLHNARGHIHDGGRFIVLVPRRNIAGKAYLQFHKRNKVGVRLYGLDELRKMATAAGWTLANYKFVFPFALVAAFEPSESRSK